VIVRNAARRACLRVRRGGVLTAEGSADALDEAASTSHAHAGSESSPEDIVHHTRDARRTLDELKERLRPREVAALSLLCEGGLSIEEVAATLRTTANNVYQMRHRILVAARENERQRALATRPC
jgi:DNA-directed RNA polymerase specialized sigma24 family protein